MDTTKQHDWGLIASGVLLVLLAAFFVMAPWLSLATMTAIAGAGFLISGVLDIVFYVRNSALLGLSGWTLAYAVLDALIGLMFLLHPLALAGVIPWLVGVFFLVFGAFEIAGALRVRKFGARIWGWMLFSGIVGVLCGITLFVSPATLIIFLALFVMMRGVSLVVYGWNAHGVSIVG